MDAMVLLYTDKPIKRGKSSLSVKLPVLVCKRFGITEDTDIQCYIGSSSVVLKFGPTDEEPGKVQEVF